MYHNYITVSKYCHWRPSNYTFISDKIDRYEYKITLVQNYGWPAGSAIK